MESGVIIGDTGENPVFGNETEAECKAYKGLVKYAISSDHTVGMNGEWQPALIKQKIAAGLINILESLATKCCVVVSWTERTYTAIQSGKGIVVCNVLAASETPFWLSG